MTAPTPSGRAITRVRSRQDLNVMDNQGMGMLKVRGRISRANAKTRIKRIENNEQKNTVKLSYCNYLTNIGTGEVKNL